MSAVTSCRCSRSGTVLFPSLVLPLHVFEPRYRAMVAHCLDGVEPEFGVVLIERGSEVGGDDVRTDVGTVARILEAAELPDGRWALVARRRRAASGSSSGCPTTRAPRAVVDDLDDDPVPGDGRLAELVGGVPDRAAPGPRPRGRARRGAGAGHHRAEPTTPRSARFQVAAVAPLGPADQHRVAAPRRRRRAARAARRRSSATQAELLEARLATRLTGSPVVRNGLR